MMKHIRLALAVALLTFAAGVPAATFNLFSPAAGILKGNPSTYVTTAATSTDVIATFTGTCNASTYLRGDGACAAPAGTGVTSVGLTVPTGFGVTGSPVTSSGSLGITTSLSGLVNGTGSGLAAATSTNVIATFSGTCNGSTFLRGDGTCAAGAGGSGGNPTQTIGLTAVNGVAASFLRSDGAPALSQAIAPTWTATHIFSKVASTGLDGAAMFSSNAPLISWFEADGTTNNKVWSAIANTEQFILQTRLDDGTGAVPIMTVDRTGTTVDTIAFASNISTTKATGFNVFSVVNSDAGAGAGSAWYLQNSSGNYFRGLYSNTTNVTAYTTNGPTGAAGYFYTTGNEPISIGTNGIERMRISGAGDVSVSGQFTSTKTGSTLASAAVVLNATTNPSIVMNQSGAAANNRQWERVIDSEQLIERVVNDANNSVSNWMVVDRTANVVDSIALTATAVTINGVDITTATTTTTAAVTGCTTDPGSAARLVRVGNTVTLRWSIGGAGTCTSNQSGFSLAGSMIPAGYQPVSPQLCSFLAVDNGVPVAGWIQIPTAGGGVNLRTALASNAWTASGAKGTGITSSSCTYTLN